MISSIENYNNNLSKSLKDKLFFTEKINTERFIDFGCGGGILINELQKLYPNAEYIGYDKNPHMIRCIKNTKNNKIITDNWQFIQDIINKKPKNTTLILSSVVHEVYSYSTQEEINTFWEMVFNSGFNHIIIRDMMLSENHINKKHEYPISHIKKVFELKKINQWENKWGPLEEHKSLIHFLLTYQYQDNWEREYKENYLPLSIEQIINKIPKSYSLQFKQHFILPYIKKIIKKDFGIDLKTKTHGKIIITKNQNI